MISFDIAEKKRTFLLKMKKTIIVEDEAIIRLNLKLILQQMNCETIGETGKGESAIELTKKLAPDFICMDIKLQGGIDGIETAKRISEFCNVPIIFMSAYSLKETKSMSEIKNDSVFLVKPIQKQQIEDAVRRICT
jgi:two-component SAPR family response regulator